MIHSLTCTCEDCFNRSRLKGMRYWVFTQHRGYMESPMKFASHEEAREWLKTFVETHGESYGGYIIFGELLAVEI